MSLYGNCYRNLLWPTYELCRGRQMWRLCRQAQQRQWWPARRLAEFQFAELRRLLDHAYANCPWYASQWQKNRLTPDKIHSIDDFSRFPSISKDDIRQHRHDMRATGNVSSIYEHRTGGSTGVPLRFFINRASYEWRQAVSQRGYSWAGCLDGERQFYLWGQPIGTPPLIQRLKTKLHNTFLRRHLVSCFCLNEALLADCARQINTFRPITIIGYTNALHTLARYILDRRLSLHRPGAIITAAEGVNSLQRAAMEQAFGAPVFASYGSREFMLIAMECEHHHGLHISADNLLVEVVRPDGSPCAEGETGEILVTDLHNYGMPFIRYKIGDLGVPTARACPCGRGLPLLERVEGRILDIIRAADGRAVPGEFFPHLIKEFPSVRQFQVIQKQLDRLHLKLVLEPGQHDDQLRRLQQEVQHVLGHSVRLDIEAVPEIPQTASGKFRVTVSELPPA